MKRIETAALLVRSVPYGEADLVVTFLTEDVGKVAAIVRGARRSTKRFAGGLEPIHGLRILLEDRGKELTVLKEARIELVRAGVVSDLAAMDAAGRALRWARHLCPPRTPEPGVFHGLVTLLDELDRRTEPIAPPLVRFGLGLLGVVGYGLDFRRCVRCGRACPDGRAAFVDVTAGGLVCTSCGGARRSISGELRTLAASVVAGEAEAMTDAQANELLDLIEEVMAAHADYDPSGAR